MQLVRLCTCCCVIVSLLLTLNVAVCFGSGDDGVDLFPVLPVDFVSENVLCSEQMRSYFDNLRNSSLWAYEMRDATAKSVTGILRGSIFQLGQFEECLTSRAPFPTQYCLATIEANIPQIEPPRDPKSLHYEPYESVLRKLYNHGDPSQMQKNKIFMGWCVPAACTPQDLQVSLNNHLTRNNFTFTNQNVTYTSAFFNEGCQTENDRSHFDNVDISFCCFVIVLTTLILISTIYDYIMDDSSEERCSPKSLGYRLCASLSIRKNFEKLSKSDDSNPALKILYGMRTFSIFMIILNHRFGTHLTLAVLNFDIVERNYRSAVATPFFHGDLFVDSFFVLSGLLVTYSLLVQFDKKFINPGFIVLLRYIRLTPIYAFVIFYYATLFNHMGSGPFWKMTVTQESLDCRNYWWTNLLYLSNYIDTNHMCMVQSWYLPCDFHYFIIAIVLCIILNKNKRAGMTVLFSTVLLSMVVPFLITLIYERPGVLHFYPEFLTAPKSYHDFDLTYIKSHTRATPYFIGMIAGYIYYKSKDSTKKLNKMVSYSILLVSFGVMFGTIFTGVIFHTPYYEYNALEAASYAALHRTVWAVGSVGVLYVASYGHASFVYKFLSWSPLIPLSKLVYGAYLVHMQFQIIQMAKKASPTAVTYFDIITLALSDIVLAFATAFVLYLGVEAPFRNIFQIIFNPTKKAAPKKNVTGHVNNNYEHGV